MFSHSETLRNGTRVQRDELNPGTFFLTAFLNKFQLSDKESAGFGKIVRVKIMRGAGMMFCSVDQPPLRTEPTSNKFFKV